MSKHDEVRPVSSAARAGYPVLGETIEGLSEHLVRNGTLSSRDLFQRVRRDAIAILRNSVPFDGPDERRTGLVVGYVQSGKTLSMTAVSALAHDNGCRIIIVLAGVTTLLLEQSARRFRDDLRAASGKRPAWRIFNSNEKLRNGARNLEQAVAEWKDPTLSGIDPQTFFYVVLKNHTHLVELEEVLKSVDLHGIPALIIDDEADQAGLNTSPDAPEASRTYRQIKAVRDALPHHTYLQYTATPQAPLLIALDDMLSPAFAELVEPGEGYTGGASFFGPTRVDGLVIPVPETDLFKPGAPPEEPPDSLLDALRVFIVGCAVASLRGAPRPRSMLVHPSQRMADHSRYMSWISDAIKRWATTLRRGDPADKSDTLEELRAAYAELSKTDASLPPFEDLQQRIQVSLNRVSVKEVNTQDGSEVDWQNCDEHILVGGEKLNRGFTVEGLTVTYMPRDAGGWNADTLQQRARFFGYKKKYLSLCRLYLHPEVISAFRSYVTHEEDIRKQLAAHRGRPLREWRRAFFLSAQMRPTRRNVLADPYYRIPRDREWFLQRHPHIDAGAGRRNLASVTALEQSISFHKDEDFFEHPIAEVPLKDVYEKLLVTYEVRGADMPNWYGVLVMIADVLETAPDSVALLVQMQGDRGRERVRSTAEGIVTLHQGKSSAKRAGAYPGDNKMIFPRSVTIQTHVVRVDGGEPVVGLAVHIPKELRRDDIGAMGER